MLTAFKSLAFIALLTMTACATPQPVLVAQLESTQDQRQLVRDFKRLTQQCWQQEPALLRDGYRVRAYHLAEDGAEFTLSKWPSGYASLPPLLTLSIRPGELGNPLLAVKAVEGSESDPYLHDAKRWLAGDLTCRQ